MNRCSEIGITIDGMAGAYRGLHFERSLRRTCVANSGDEPFVLASNDQEAFPGLIDFVVDNGTISVRLAC